MYTEKPQLWGEKNPSLARRPKEAFWCWTWIRPINKPEKLVLQYLKVTGLAQKVLCSSSTHKSISDLNLGFLKAPQAENFQNTTLYSPFESGSFSNWFLLGGGRQAYPFTLSKRKSIRESSLTRAFPLLPPCNNSPQVPPEMYLE